MQKVAESCFLKEFGSQNLPANAIFLLFVTFEKTDYMCFVLIVIKYYQKKEMSIFWTYNKRRWGTTIADGRKDKW